MTTKQELEAKIQDLSTQLQSATQQKNANCSILKANAKPEFRNKSCTLLADAVFEDPSAIIITIIVTAAKNYERFDQLEFKLTSQLKDTQNQLKALEANSLTPKRTSPTLPGDASRVASPNQRIRLDGSDIEDLPPTDEEVAAKLNDEANKKAGIAVDKGIADREQGRGYDLPDSTEVTEKITKATLSPSTWGVKITSSSSTYYMHLLPAISGNLNGTGHMDVPNVMPGLNFKFLSSYAKHKIPGWAPVYQALGIDTVLVTMIGMFTGEDGTTVPTSANAPEVKGLTSPLIQSTNFNKNDHTTAALNRTTNKLDTYENLQSFINFGVQKQQTITIEVNIAKNGIIRPTSKTTGGIRGSNGNPTFTGIIRSLDTYYRRFDRTYYILTMEITKGIGSDCAGKPLNLTNKLDEVVKSQLAKMDNSCKVGVTEGQADKTPEEQKKVVDSLKDACYRYGAEGNNEKAFLITNDGSIQTGIFEYSTNGTLNKSTPGPLYENKAAVDFLVDNQDIKNRKDCNIKVGSTEDRIKTVLSSASISYKTPPPPTIDNLQLEGEPFGTGELEVFSGKGYGFTKEGYLVYVDYSISNKIKILSVIEANQAAKLLTETPGIGTDFKQHLKRFLENPNVIYVNSKVSSSVNNVGRDANTNPIGSTTNNSNVSPYGNSNSTNKNPYGN